MDTPIKRTYSAARYRAERDRRIAEGLCLWCMSKTEGKKFCPSCLQEQRERYAEHRAKGLCYCGKPRVEGRKRCDACLARSAISGKKQRIKHQDAGLCFCGGKKRRNRKTCDGCAGRWAERVQQRKAAGLCRCGRQAPVEGKANCTICIENKLAFLRERRAKVVDGYGGKCVCCGDDDPNVLELHHVNGDGSSHRREVGSTWKLQQWAIDNNFPDRVELLCANCHTAKTRTGDCSYRKARVRRRKQ